jgi:4-oxalocrotonate tautomerase family enzyme
MPIIKVEGPVIPVEKKRALVRGLTEAAVAAYGDLSADSIFVLISEYQTENVGAGGELIADIRAAKGAGQKGAGQTTAGQGGAGQRSG